MTEAGHCYVLVTASGATGWQLDPTAAATAPVLDRAAGGQVSGQGYAVVRHTGPETGMMLTHESKGALDLPVVWALDERLEPVRRIATAPGLHTFPTGFLQIRTGGAWSLEIR